MQLLTIIIVPIGIILFCLFVFFLYRLYKNKKEILKQEKEYKNRTYTNLTLLQSVYEDTLSGVQQLQSQDFFGAKEVLRKLNQQEKMIGAELFESLEAAKKHEEVVSIATDIEIIGDKLKKSAIEIFENHNIEITIRKNLETQTEDLKRKIESSMPQARQIIDKINKENPETIWRNFDYKNLDRNIETSFNKSEQAVKISLHNLDGHMYKEAKKEAQSAIAHMNNSLEYIQSIFDVNHQIGGGKEKYNQYIKDLPQMIGTTEGAVSRNHVSPSTASLIVEIKSRYDELQLEIKKQDQLDWILIGALVMAIVTQCDNTVRKSSRDIRNYEEEEARKIKRKQEGSYGGSTYAGGFGGNSPNGTGIF